MKMVLTLTLYPIIKRLTTTKLSSFKSIIRNNSYIKVSHNIHRFSDVLLLNNINETISSEPQLSQTQNVCHLIPILVSLNVKYNELFFRS